MHINTRFLAILALSLLFSGCASGIAFADAATLQDPDDPQADIAKAEQVLKEDPNSYRAWYHRGYALFKLGRFNEASTAFKESIRLNPKHELAYVMLGHSYSRLDQFDDARVAFDEAIKLNAKDLDYRRFRDSLSAYVKLRKDQNAALQPVLAAEGDNDYAASVYTGIFSEALVHHDFDLIERAANEARASKEKVGGGRWKLQLIYDGVNHPYISSSDYEWNQHIELLQQWAREKPNSATANVALADCYNGFGWRARGTGFSNTVSGRNWQLYRERLKLAQAVLLAAKSQRVCPKWYAVMQAIAIAQGWDNESYENLFNESVQYEPTWYEYYKQKAMYLLPRWHGQPGELDAYVNRLAVDQNRKDSPILYFLVTEAVGSLDVEVGQKPAAHYEVLKQGYFDLRKLYGVSSRDTDWVFSKAVQANDVDLAKEMLPNVKGTSSAVGSRVTKEMFDELAKKYAEQQKQQQKAP